MVRREAEVFPPEGEASVAAGHVVERLDLGRVDPAAGPIRITLIAETKTPIGIDSLVVTRLRKGE